jgi:hypothetical protein
VRVLFRTKIFDYGFQNLTRRRYRSGSFEVKERTRAALEKEIPEINGKLISTTIEAEMQSIFYDPTKFF